VPFVPQYCVWSTAGARSLAIWQVWHLFPHLELYNSCPGPPHLVHYVSSPLRLIIAFGVVTNSCVSKSQDIVGQTRTFFIQIRTFIYPEHFILMRRSNMGMMIDCKVCGCEYEFKGGSYRICSTECSEEHKSRRTRVYQVLVADNRKKSKFNAEELAEGREIYSLWLKTGRID